MLGLGSGIRGLVEDSVLCSDVPGTGSVSWGLADGGTLRTKDTGSGLCVCRDGPLPPTIAWVVVATAGGCVFWAGIPAGAFLGFSGSFFGSFGVDCVGLVVLFWGLFWGVPGAFVVVGTGVWPAPAGAPEPSVRSSLLAGAFEQRTRANDGVGGGGWLVVGGSA